MVTTKEYSFFGITKKRKMVTNNIKMLITFVVVVTFFVLIIGDVQHKENVKKISLFVLIIASAYLGVLFGNRKNGSRKEGDGNSTRNSPILDIPQEFQEEQDKFRKLSKEGKIK